MAHSLPRTTSSPTLRIREATLDDADSYVTAMLAGYEIDHQFVYRYPFRKEYPEDAHKASVVVFKENMANQNTIPIVAEVPKVRSDGSPTNEWTIAAIACWEWKSLKDVQNEARESLPRMMSSLATQYNVDYRSIRLLIR
jgi:hypothetical protein